MILYKFARDYSGMHLTEKVAEVVKKTTTIIPFFKQMLRICKNCCVHACKKMLQRKASGVCLMGQCDKLVVVNLQRVTDRHGPNVLVKSQKVAR